MAYNPVRADQNTDRVSRSVCQGLRRLFDCILVDASADNSGEMWLYGLEGVEMQELWVEMIFSSTGLAGFPAMHAKTCRYTLAGNRLRAVSSLADPLERFLEYVFRVSLGGLVLHEFPLGL